jgi:hypothetical protein
MGEVIEIAGQLGSRAAEQVDKELFYCIMVNRAI